MSDIRRHWDSQLENNLPDCRLKDPSSDIVERARMKWERVYCANCGHPGALVTAGFFAHAFYICDPCARKLGPPPLPEIFPAHERE